MEELNLNIQGQVSPEAQERFERPRNYGPLAEWNGHVRITGPCGDTMEFWVQVTDKRIAKVGFTTTGCGPSRAAGSMATELAIGRPLRDAGLIEQADILKALGGLPKDSEHCALLASNTLRAAVRDYHSRAAPVSQDCEHCSSTSCSTKEQQRGESDEQFRDRQALARKMCQIGHKLLVMSGKEAWAKVPLPPTSPRRWPWQARRSACWMSIFTARASPSLWGWRKTAWSFTARRSCPSRSAISR